MLNLKKITGLKFIISAGIIFISVFLDQLTKFLIVDHFSNIFLRKIEVIENFFYLTFVKNYGVTFGMLRNLDDSIRRPLLILMPLMIMSIILVIIFKTDKKEVITFSGFALIISGAVGNLIDRIRLNYVVDFLDFCLFGLHWPSFNIADTAIVAGMGLLFIEVLRGKDVFRTGVKKKDEN